MRIRILVFAVLVILAGSSAYAQVMCSRNVLNSYADRYWSALVAHDPDRLPLTPDARYTENGQTLKLGDGIWGVPVLKAGDYKIYIADSDACQVGFIGTFFENNHQRVVFLRLKIEGARISEMECLIPRSSGMGAPGAKPQPLPGLVDKPIFSEALPPEDRPSRWELANIANLYFEAMEKGTGQLTPFDDECTRVENGMITANNKAGQGIGKMACRQQFDTGFSFIITKVRERRYPIIDTERGMVLAFVFLDHAGTFPEFKMTDGTPMKVSAPFDAPYSFIMAEVFKIKNKKITQVEAVLLEVPYGMPSGWVK
jgi:hypothetical protein